MASIDMPAKKVEHKREAIQWEPIIFHTINYALLILLCVLMVYPMLNTLALSFNEGMDAVRGGIRLWPRIFTLENYQVVFARQSIQIGMRVSVMRTVVSVVTNILVTSMLAFALSRPEFVFRKFISLAFVVTMYLQVGLIPWFILNNNILGMGGTFAVYWVPTMISAFNLIVIRTYMKSVSESLVESARLDGASDFRIYAQIIMPLCKPTLATIALFVAVGAWNAWFDAFIFNSGSPQWTVLQFELMTVLNQAMMAGMTGGAAQAVAGGGAGSMVTPGAIRAAITVVAAVPILLVYPFMQRYFVHGIQLGGVKE